MSTHMRTHTHRPMQGLTGWYCGACGQFVPTPKPAAIPESVLIELVEALVAMRGAA
jgi:hypothetical protein